MAFIGIDLGTTNSLIACYSNGKSTLIPNSLGDLITPSVVSVDEQCDDIYIGAIARERLVSHPELCAAQFKRNMGTNKEYHLANKTFNAVELSSLILGSLKRDAEKYLGEKVSNAVISVPAYFNDVQRAATMTAAKLAGLQVDRLLNEPTAAAIVHGIELDKEQQCLVLDLGGGTFDVTVLEVFDGVLEVLASAGDNHLGGEDFTFKLSSELQRLFELENAPLSTVYALAEQIKKTLSTHSNASLSITVDEQDHNIDYSRKEFKTLVEPMLAALTVPIVKAMKDAKMAPEDLDQILFVGGATRMQVFTQHISRMFGTTSNVQKDPDHIVAIGAAMQAALIARDAAFNDIVLTDVMSFSLGTSAVSDINNNNEHFVPIIERNTTIPVSRTSEFSSLRPDQENVTFSIYQGESRDLRNNLLLGALQVDLPKSDQCETIEVRYTYDANGLLEVEATIVRTGIKKTLVLQNNAERMSEDEISSSLKKLEALKIHPAEKQQNKLLLARGERLFEFATGEERNYISHLMACFEQAMSTQDERVIRKAHAQVKAQFDDIDQAG